MKILALLLKIIIFAALLGFALNNQALATVYFFMDWQWTAPLAFIILCVFAAGLLAGILLMASPWWSQRTRARRSQAQLDAMTAQMAAAAPSAATSSKAHAAPTPPTHSHHGI